LIYVYGYRSLRYTFVGYVYGLRYVLRLPGLVTDYYGLRYVTVLRCTFTFTHVYVTFTLRLRFTFYVTLRLFGYILRLPVTGTLRLPLRWVGYGYVPVTYRLFTTRTLVGYTLRFIWLVPTRLRLRLRWFTVVSFCTFGYTTRIGYVHGYGYVTLVTHVYFTFALRFTDCTLPAPHVAFTTRTVTTFGYRFTLPHRYYVWLLPVTLVGYTVTTVAVLRLRYVTTFTLPARWFTVHGYGWLHTLGYVLRLRLRLRFTFARYTFTFTFTYAFTPHVYVPRCCLRFVPGHRYTAFTLRYGWLRLHGYVVYVAVVTRLPLRLRLVTVAVVTVCVYVALVYVAVTFTFTHVLRLLHVYGYTFGCSIRYTPVTLRLRYVPHVYTRSTVVVPLVHGLVTFTVTHVAYVCDTHRCHVCAIFHVTRTHDLILLFTLRFGYVARFTYVTVGWWWFPFTFYVCCTVTRFCTLRFVHLLHTLRFRCYVTVTFTLLRYV